jgi:hypothetical protein
MSVEQVVDRARKRAILNGKNPDLAEAEARTWWLGDRAARDGGTRAHVERTPRVCAVCVYRAMATLDDDGRAYCQARDEDRPAAFACDRFERRT